MTNTRALSRIDNRSFFRNGTAENHTRAPRLFLEGHARDLRDGAAEGKTIRGDFATLFSCRHPAAVLIAILDILPRGVETLGPGLMDLCVYGRTRVRGWLIGGTVKPIKRRVEEEELKEMENKKKI